MKTELRFKRRETMGRRSRAPFLAIALTGATVLAGCSFASEARHPGGGFQPDGERPERDAPPQRAPGQRSPADVSDRDVEPLRDIQTSLSAGLGGSYSRVLHPVENRAADSLTRALSPSVGATVSANPTYSLAVLDTQEFMRGFLSPLGKSLLAYYWNQGWPREFLIYLMVERVEIAKADTGEVVES